MVGQRGEVTFYEIGRQDLSELQRVADWVGQLHALVGEEGEVEGDILSDDSTIAQEKEEVAGDGGEGRRAFEVVRRDAGEELNGGG